MEWKIYKSISDLPCNIWDEKISNGHPAKTSEFIKVLERSCNDREFNYLVCYEQNEIVGCCLVTINKIDGCIFLQPKASKWVNVIRKCVPHFLIFNVIMTGTLETTGRHWWFNTKYFSWNQYIDRLFIQIERHFYKRSHVMIMRDFFTGAAPASNESYQLKKKTVPRKISFPLQSRGFRQLSNLPLAIINLNRFAEQEYYKNLKERDRATIRKIRTIIEKKDLIIEDVEDYGHLIDEMYRLYLAVNEHAKEMKTPPLPRKFFEILNEHLPISNATVFRDGNKNLICFVLSFDNNKISNPYFIGMDYRVARQSYLLYSALWSTISRAIKSRQPVIDFGVTNYFVKQGLGAKLKTMNMFVRFTNPLLNKLLSRFIEVIFEPKLPMVRSSKEIF